MRNIENIALVDLKKYKRNNKIHPKKQVEALAKSIEAFGFNTPIIIDADNTIIAGHGRLEAAESLGLEAVPCIRVTHLTKEQVVAYRLADNRIAELGETDWDAVDEELSYLALADFDMSSLGFDDSPAEVYEDDDEDGSDSKSKTAKTCPKCGFPL